MDVGHGVDSQFTAQTPYLSIGWLFALLGVGIGLAVPATGMVVMSCGAATAVCHGLGHHECA